MVLRGAWRRGRLPSGFCSEAYKWASWGFIFLGTGSFCVCKISAVPWVGCGCAQSDAAPVLAGVLRR